MSHFRVKISTILSKFERAIVIYSYITYTGSGQPILQFARFRHLIYNVGNSMIYYFPDRDLYFCK